MLPGVVEVTQALKSERASSQRSQPCCDDVNPHPLHKIFEPAFSGETLRELHLSRSARIVVSVPGVATVDHRPVGRRRVSAKGPQLRLMQLDSD